MDCLQMAPAAPINPLANAKGTKLVCELCQKPAFLGCVGCNVTYYCTPEHKITDWNGIHCKICKLLIPLRSAQPFLTLEEDRKARQRELTRQKAHNSAQQAELILMTRTVGEKLLFEGHHEQAIPAATQSLKFALEIYGLASLELVPSYLLLAEASIGLGQLDQAEEYLSQAEWTVLKTPDCSNTVRYRLFRILGLLHSARGNYDEALRYFADDMGVTVAAFRQIFHASIEHSPEDIHTAGGFFHMANVFFRQNQMDAVTSLYEKVLSIWYAYLLDVVARRCREVTAAAEVFIAETADEAECRTGLDEAQEAEAKKILHAIDDFYAESEDGAMRTRLTHALAMLYFMLEHFETALKYSDTGLTYFPASPPADEEASETTDAPAPQEEPKMRTDLMQLKKASEKKIELENERRRTKHSFFEGQEGEI